jgi:YD repeat-containing protein
MFDRKAGMYHTLFGLILPCACFLFIGMLVNVSAAAETFSVVYQYDAEQRLIKAIYPGKAIEYTYDAAGNLLTKTVSATSECTGCDTSPVNLTNVTYSSGTSCECRDSTSITIGSGVIVKSGADVTFIAPKIFVKPGAKFANGAKVKTRQQ